MAKKVVRYLLEANGTIPICIEDGGYFKLGEELVGITVDAAKWHVPNTLIQLSRTDLINRAITIGMKDFDGNLLTNEQIEILINNFLAERGLESYV